MNVLITGANGSLGSALTRHIYGTFAGEVIEMPKSIFLKNDIDSFVKINAADIDAAVLNDGTNHLSWIGETEEQDEEIIQRNVMAPYWTLNALVRERGRENPMRVVFVTSQTYRVPQRTTSLYCASKAAATMLMRVAARELAPYGWVINAVAPGKIKDTVMSELTDAQVNCLRGWTQEQADQYATKLIPAGRFTDKEEICKVIMQVLHMESYVNGAVIEVFGGV